MLNPETVVLLLPPGHPWVGQHVDVYPSSGATTYLEGRIHCTTSEAQALHVALADLRRTLSNLQQS